MADTELSPCIITTWWSHGGYASRSKRNGTKVMKVYAHRFAWETAFGPIPDGMHVGHLCGVKTCINPEHLELQKPHGRKAKPKPPKPASRWTMLTPCPDTDCTCTCHDLLTLAPRSA